MKIGRNDPCPCGSGRKYKKCCIRKNIAAGKNLKESPAGNKREQDAKLTNENYLEVILNELKQPPSLLDYFKNYVKTHEKVIDPEWGRVMLSFIRAHKEKNPPDIEKYYKSLKKYPINSFAETIIGQLHLTYHGNLFKAMEKYKNAVELRPDDANCHYNLGYAYFLLGIFDKSAEHYKKAVINYKNANYPEQVKARSLYNIAVYKINIEEDYTGAKKLLKQALRVMPDYPEARHALRTIKKK